jgi:hypothetical protein
MLASPSAAHTAHATGSTEIYGVLRAVGWGAIAVIGGCVPAWLFYYLDQRDYRRAIVTALAGIVCIGVTVTGSMGGLVKSADERLAERGRALTTAKDDRAEIERIQRERAKLDPRPIGTIKAEIETARAGRACDAYRKLERELATAEEAGRLDANLANLRTKDGHAPASIEVDPQASAFSQLTGLSVDTAIALNALWLSLAVEIGAMFTMLIAYSQPAEVPIAPARAPIAEASEPEILMPTPMLAHSEPADVLVKRFVLQCLPRAKGEEVTGRAVYARFERWCSDQDVAPLSAREFAEEFSAIRKSTASGCAATAQILMCSASSWPREPRGKHLCPTTPCPYPHRSSVR